MDDVATKRHRQPARQLAATCACLIIVAAPAARGSTAQAHAPAPSGPPTLAQVTSLSGSGAVGPAGFGQSVALSGNGGTALVGGDSDNQNLGAVWLLTRSGDTWAQQGSKLTNPDGELFGASVALSADGDTALIGSPDSDYVAGAAWVYTRSGRHWSPHPVALPRRGERGGGWFGSAVALSANGEVALVGAPLDAMGAGAAWLFTRSGSGWIQAGAMLAPSHPGAAGQGFGMSVALSQSGSVALIGADDAAYLFVRSGRDWKQAGGALTAPGGNFGSSVALSASGDVALIGDYSVNGPGSAWIITRNGTSWTRRVELRTDGEAGAGEFGKSVALSASGRTALIGGPLDNSGQGAAWTFGEHGGKWEQSAGKLTAGGEHGDGQFGSAVALSASGATALVGAPLNANASGAVWLFGTSASGAP